MPAKRIVIPGKKLAEGRFLYEQTLTPMDDIAALMGISRGTLRSRLKELGWEKRCDDPHARGFQRYRRRAAVPEDKPEDEDKEPARGYPRGYEERLKLVQQLQGVVKRQVDALESVLPAPSTPEQADRSARVLASLFRTLREMTRLEAPPAPAEPTDDDDVPRDLDELRRELSRKVDALIAGRTREAAGGTQTS
jgi:hypothetical protein